MTYVTELVQQYRIALRHLWNLHFRTYQSPSDWDALRDFKGLKVPLFLAMVANRLEPYMAPSVGIFGEAFRVVPKLSDGNQERLMVMYVDVGFSDRPGEQWKEIRQWLRPEQLKLTLIDFFDWEELSWRDFRYYRVRIHALEGLPDTVNRDGLIENPNVDIVWEPAGFSTGPGRDLPTRTQTLT